MTRDEYDGWCQHHAESFGLVWEEQLKALAKWFPAIGHYARDRLDEATNRLLRVKKEYRDMQGMRVALIGVLQDLDAVSPDVGGWAGKLGECSCCGDSGFVRVPHPKGVVDGKWRPVRIAGGASYYTLAVTCHCFIGRRYWSVSEGKRLEGKRLFGRLTLDVYERQVCPHWREEMAERKRIEEAGRAILHDASDKVAAKDSLRKKFDSLVSGS